MDERKFTTCNLALDTVVLKIASLRSEYVKNILKEIKMSEEDLSEKTIALELDDIYEYCVLLEPGDEDQPSMKDVVDAFMKELPHYDEYNKIYGWHETD